MIYKTAIKLCNKTLTTKTTIKTKVYYTLYVRKKEREREIASKKFMIKL